MYQSVLVLFCVTSVLGSKSLLEGDVLLTDGVKLVSIPVPKSLEEETGRSLGEGSVLFRLARFLQGHELHIKLPNLVEKDKMTSIFTETLKAVDETYKDSAVTGRGKGGGGASIALLGLMFGKTLGALGIGGLGLLTMKALAASALALMLSAIVGVKKLSSHDDHDDHQVIYADHHGHHHKKREAPLNTPLPYQAWSNYESRSKKMH